MADVLKSYPSAIHELGGEVRPEIGRQTDNRAVNSHSPFRRSALVMIKFRQIKALQKFACVHAKARDHFAALLVSLDRHLIDPLTYKADRSAGLAEWQNFMARGNVRRGEHSAKLKRVSIRLTATSWWPS